MSTSKHADKRKEIKALVNANLEVYRRVMSKREPENSKVYVCSADTDREWIVMKVVSSKEQVIAWVEEDEPFRDYEAHEVE